MSDPTNGDDTEASGGHIAYAPKWAREHPARDPDHLDSPSIADAGFPQHDERSLADEPADPPRTVRSLNDRLTEARQARSARYQPAESMLPRNSAQSMSERDLLRQSLEPEVIAETWPARRREWRPATLAAAAVIMASIGAAILLFIMSNLPDEWQRIPQLKTEFKSRFSGNPASSVATPTAPAAPVIGSQRNASLTASGERGPAVRGMTDNAVLFGMAAPFTGSAKALGQQMKLGIETAINVANDAGGINGRQLKLTAADDGYEPARTADVMKQLYERQQVFGFIGNVGTPTAMVALPYALERRTLFFGPFTGADLLRRDPPDRYVFNYRASYAEETNAVVRYLVNVRRLRPDQIAVFAQRDAYGDAGFAGVAKAIRALHGDDSSILRVGYERNTVDVDDAVSGLGGHRPAIKAIVMVATYRASARFIEKTRDQFPSMIYTNVSFVGSTALADELMLLGPRYANGIIVTQVVPAVNGYASINLRYRNALAKYFPGEPPDYVSLEGYVDATVLLEAIKRTGPQLDTEKLVDTFRKSARLRHGSRYAHQLQPQRTSGFAQGLGDPARRARPLPAHRARVI